MHKSVPKKKTQHYQKNAYNSKTQKYSLIGSKSDNWHVTHTKNPKEEDKLIETGFEYVRYSDKDEVAIYRKRK